MSFYPEEHWLLLVRKLKSCSVEDPGFPMEVGAWTSWGGVDSRGGYVSKIVCVEMKEC